MKIAILGTENTHAYEFCKLLKSEKKYADVDLIGVYGFDAEANQKYIDEGLAPYISETPFDFLGKVDAIVVTTRHGDLHHEYALPYLKAGIPAFIDKPLAVDVQKAFELIHTAEQHGALLCGGSSLKFLDEYSVLKRFLSKRTPIGGYIAAPVSMNNPYGGFFFYSQHLTECLVTIFGSDIQSVYATCPEDTKDCVSITFRYPTFDVVAQYTDSNNYTATVLTKQGCLSASAPDVVYCYERELDEFVDMVRNGRMLRSYQELAYPTLLLHSIEESFRTGKWVNIEW